MPIRTRLDAIKIARVLFEARYDEGYRYLDHCGETLVRIRKHSRSWVVGPADPQRAVLVNNKHQLTLNLGNDSMIVSTNSELDAAAMDKQIEIVGRDTESLYNIIVETLRVPNTTRVGMRCLILAPADSLEEAHRFICKVPGSPLQDHLISATHFELRNTSHSCVLEEPESGLRKRIQVSVVAQVEPDSPPITGLASDEGTGGIMVDVDTFTRPEKGHFAATSMFIQENYLSAKGLAMNLFDWMLKHQK